MARRKHRRPWSWRWLVIEEDELLGEHEVVWGYWTKRSAEHEAKMCRIQIGGGYVHHTVERAKRG